MGLQTRWRVWEWAPGRLPKWSRRHTAISLSHPNSETREERMTITIKARTAALILALFCVLAGLALGQLTQAHSATATSSVSRCP